jgi:ABC-2 type transport system ATP-binding protein
MRRRLNLACGILHRPRVVLLDEPTVGVDPLSRRELWEIVLGLVRDDRLTVLVSTSYLDEAERCDHAVVLHEGKVLAQGPPGEVTARAAGRSFMATPAPGSSARSLQARIFRLPGIIDAVPEAGRVRVVRAQVGGAAAPLVLDDAATVPLAPVPPRFEDGFMTLLYAVAGERGGGEHRTEMHLDRPPAAHGGDSGIAVEVHDLVRRFGDFTAVDHISFRVRRGEIYGLLGPNGAGKSTTFRMLCGLLPASGGTLRVAGADLRRSRAEARTRLGYVAQKFSLYGQLSVDENLDFFASAYGLLGRRKAERIAWAKAQFELAPFSRLPSGQLPGGFRQRLAMAAALLHEPEILFLDEATSGADPLARREFWGRITALSEQGVTIIITTHFMEEAEYCDRVMILDAGRSLAEGTPAEIRAQAGPANGREEPTMEDAFIAIVEKARKGRSPRAAPSSAAA